MSINGSWNITMKTPMGEKEATLELNAGDNSDLSGTLNTPLGPVAFKEGKVNGNDISFSAKMSGMPMTVKATATIEGDNISGEAKMGPFGTSIFSGTRA